MKKYLIILIIIIVIFVIGIFFVPKYQTSIDLSQNAKLIPEQNNQIIKNQVCFKYICFDVELALTSQEQSLGLMNRKELAANSGMLFIFKDLAKHTFWMKNTLIFLDIIWLDSDKKVVYINKNTPPCSQNTSCSVYMPDNPALYVLEINAGLVDQYNIKEQDQAFLNLK